MPLIISIAISVTVFLVLVALFTAAGADSKGDRLKAVKEVNKTPETEAKKEKLKFSERRAQRKKENKKKKLNESIKKKDSKNAKTEELENLLELAGYDITAGQFSIVRLIIAFSAIALAAVVCVVLKVNTTYTMLAIAVFGLLAMILPNTVIKRQVKARTARMRNQLPDIMDLLVVSVEAGLGFDAALMRLYEKNKSEMMLELVQATKDIQRGMSKKEAYDSLAQRCGIKELTSFLSALVQADQLGISIKSVLVTQSEAMRLERKQKAEEKALKAPVLMMLPMVMFIFPVIFVVLLGPALMNITEMF